MIRSAVSCSVLATVLLSSLPAWGMTFDTEVPARHNRFINGQVNPSFFPYVMGDISGVAKVPAFAEPRSGALLITPRHFITAEHLKPTNPNIPQVSFYNAAGGVHSRTVSSYTRVFANGVATDISVGTLSSAINPLNTGVSPYAIAVGFDQHFVGKTAITFGRYDRGGANVIESVELLEPDEDSPGIGTNRGIVTVFQTAENGGGGIPVDEAGLASGDSGNAALLYYNGEFLALGTHYGIASGLPEVEEGEPDPFEDLRFTQFDPYFSASSLLSPYVDQINAIVGADGYSLDLVFIPEPSSAAILVLASVGCLSGRRRR